MAETARARHLHLVTAADVAAATQNRAPGGTSVHGGRVSDEPTARPVAGEEPLWRHVLGDHLRRLRHERGERLADTAARAGVSPQYLSEMERGRKEPSSEMIAAVAGALDVTLVDLTLGVADTLRAVRSGTPAGPTCRAPLALAA